MTNQSSNQRGSGCGNAFDELTGVIALNLPHPPHISFPPSHCGVNGWRKGRGNARTSVHAVCLR